MAGDWIPWDVTLPTKRETVLIARATGLSPYYVAGLLMDLWSWADHNTEDGIVPGMDVPGLSLVVGDKDVSFWEQVRAVGWLLVYPDRIEIPNYDTWLGRNAKRRMKEALKKRHQRRNRNRVPHARGQKGDKKGTRQGTEQGTTGQDSTVEKNTPLNPPLDTPEFRAAWERWCAYRRERRQSLTPSTEEKQLVKLASWGIEAAIASIDQSITNGWQGLFEPRKGHGTGKDVGSVNRVGAPDSKYANIGRAAGSAPSARPPAGDTPAGNDAQRGSG